MKRKKWTINLTWLRVRVPSRRLAETWGHEYIVLGNCKGANGPHGQHTNQRVHYKHEHREIQMHCLVNKWPYLNVGVETRRFFPFLQGGSRFPRLYLNLGGVSKCSKYYSTQSQGDISIKCSWFRHLPSPSSALEPSAVRCKRKQHCHLSLQTPNHKCWSMLSKMLNIKIMEWKKITLSCILLNSSDIQPENE